MKRFATVEFEFESEIVETNEFAEQLWVALEGVAHIIPHSFEPEATSIVNINVTEVS